MGSKVQNLRVSGSERASKGSKRGPGKVRGGWGVYLSNVFFGVILTHFAMTLLFNLSTPGSGGPYPPKTPKNGLFSTFSGYFKAFLDP